ncbi:MAG: hypothetical protein ACI841_001044 [Planctomycetota bacterium]|jgi:hypothetical protein
MPNSERKKPSAWHSGNRNTRRSVRAVSIARSEYLRGAPRLVEGLAFHALITLGVTQQGDIATLDEGTVVGRPIGDTVAGLIVRVHAGVHATAIGSGRLITLGRPPVGPRAAKLCTTALPPLRHPRSPRCVNPIKHGSPILPA